MKLRLSARAEADLDDIASYIFAEDPKAATRVQARLEAALHFIAEHPEAGRAIGRGLRRLAVPRLPYLIFYRVDQNADAVAVATVRHSARRPID